MLMTALANEDETTIQMEYAPKTKCRSCDEEASYGNATAATHIEVQMSEDANFQDLFDDVYGMRSMDTRFSMFGEYYQFQSFAEYRSNDRGLSGHYQAWVRGENGMGCISDKDNKGEQHDVDLENFVVTI
ncbi:hypothetical protein CRE_19888 [Caenorhabditis remanei]|uniref:Uncharacterized protein n=1 Tax=Caenorhabditis remanei TaxID=31234 RepID=E3N2Z6_CAERE|nr:hypothetical protein CRE_19888 [Caenorhabditis remanei]